MFLKSTVHCTLLSLVGIIWFWPMVLLVLAGTSGVSYAFTGQVRKICEFCQVPGDSHGFPNEEQGVTSLKKTSVRSHTPKLEINATLCGYIS
jgi:hypothetical protein